MFEITSQAIKPYHEFNNPQAGAVVSFEGRVRNTNNQRSVRGLEYEIYEMLAVKEGLKIIDEALNRFEILGAYAVHRYGQLEIGDVAVFVCTNAMHREAAFTASRYLIDEIKLRLPIWKKEHYLDGPAEWVACHHCAQAKHG